MSGTIPKEFADPSIALLGGLRRLQEMEEIFVGDIPEGLEHSKLRELQAVEELGPVGLRILELDDNPRLNGTLPSGEYMFTITCSIGHGSMQLLNIAHLFRCGYSCVIVAQKSDSYLHSKYSRSTILESTLLSFHWSIVT